MVNRIRQWVGNCRLPLLLVSCCALLSISLLISWWSDSRPPILRMSAGPENTRRHTVAQYVVAEASHNGLPIELIATAGSEDCLNRLKAKQLDAAIVSNGVVVPDDRDLMIVAALQVEAVHVLVRKDMANGEPLAKHIRGKRVNLGVPGSTERLMARDFLKFARVKLPTSEEAGEIIPMELSKSDLHQRCQAILAASGTEKEKLIADLPDCLLVLASMPSQVAQQLIDAADYRIVPLPATQAFLLDTLQEGHARTTVLEREFLERTVIPMNSYFTTRGWPEADCQTIGTRLLVVVHRDAAHPSVQRLMKTLFEAPLAHRLQTKSPREIANSYSIHPVAASYLDRDKPVLLINKAMEWFSKGLSFFGAFSAGALSLYSFLRRKKTRTPTEYFAEIRKLELASLQAKAVSQESAAAGELSQQLDRSFAKLRQELIEDICEGRIKGDLVIANILAVLRDARRHTAQSENIWLNPEERRDLSSRIAA